MANSIASFAERLNQIPLLICGPILRRADPEKLSVFVVTRAACKVRLRLHETSDPASQIILIAEAETKALGIYLHPCLVTADLTGSTLELGRSYGYNVECVSCDGNNETMDLASAGLLDSAKPLGYRKGLFPTLVLPPARVDELRFFHGSCRKPHGIGLDGLAPLDTIVCSSVTDGDEPRPHQLYLTGDQIYADDVAEPLLCLCRDIGQTLLGTPEPPPGTLKEWPREFEKGSRQELLCGPGLAALTSEKAANHLVFFAEYVGMYLVVWNRTLWPSEGDMRSLFGDPPGIGDEEIVEAGASGDNHHIWQFYATLPQVQRALANVPTYMIFDDHDVTDDWNLSGEWCRRVYSNSHPLGSRIVRNALAAYTVFQAWGNDPDQFTEGKRGARALELICGGAINDPWNEELGKLLRVDPRLPVEEGIDWHYSIRFPSHRLAVLDTRTCRRFKDEDEGGAELIAEEHMNRQLIGPLDHDDPDPAVTVVVSPGPVFGVRLVEDIQRLSVSPWVRHNPILKSLQGVCETIDAEAWRLHEEAFQNLIRALGRGERVVLLSGDVHYAFTKRCELLDGRTGKHSVIAQLTASSFKNESVAIWMIHQWGSVLQGMDPRYYHGWDTTNEDIAIKDPDGKHLTEPYHTSEPVPATRIRRIYKTRNTVVIESKGSDWNPVPESQWKYQLLTQGQPTTFLHALIDLFRAYGTSLPYNLKVVRKRHAHLWRALKPSHALWNTKYAGKTITGVSCIGDIQFQSEPLAVTHRLWWRKPLGEVGAYTEHTTSLVPSDTWPPPEQPGISR